jgi:hypothetical protein
VAFASGWLANGWRLGEQIAEASMAAQQERAEAFRWVAAEQAKSAQSMAQADQAAQEKLTNAEQDLSRLERCIADGSGCGLRIKVRTAPAKCGGVSEAGATTGLGAGAVETAELDPSLGSDYRALRIGIVELEEALRLCVSQSMMPEQ